MAKQPSAEESAGTTLATRGASDSDGAIEKFKPSDPVGSASNLAKMLESRKASLAAVLPRHLTPERLVKLMLTAVNRQPEILQCTQASVMESVMRSAELGLDCSGTLGEAYIVPFNNKVTIDGKDYWQKQAILIPGYRGLAKLARQSGEISRIEAEVVYANDKFTFRKGLNAVLDFEPFLGDERGNPIGAYALTQFKDGGVQMEFMTVSDIEKVRQTSKAGSDKRTGAPIGVWKKHWSEMARKTVFRRLSKWLPLSSEKFADAIEADNRAFDMEQIDTVLEVESAGGSGNAGLRGKLGVEDGEDEERVIEGSATDVGRGELLPTVGKVLHGIVEGKTGITDSEQRSGIIQRWADAKDIPLDDLALPSDGSEKPTAIIEMAQALKSWELYIRRE